MAELLEPAGAMREVSGSSPSLGGHKNLCGRREPPDYVSFRRVVKRMPLHTLNTHDTKPRTTLLTKALHFGTGFRSVSTRCRSVISS